MNYIRINIKGGTTMVRVEYALYRKIVQLVHSIKDPHIRFRLLRMAW